MSAADWRDIQTSSAWREIDASEAMGDLDGAAQRLAELVRQVPDRPEPAFRLCLINLQRGTAEGASTPEALLTRFPDYAPGWEAIGRFMLAAGKPEAALLCFRRMAATGTDPSSSLLIGSALRALGRIAAAREAFADARTRDPSSVRATFLAALCAQDMEDWSAAAEGYRAALARDPDRVEALVNLGIVLQAMGDLDAAKEAYGAALRRRPDSFGRISQALTMAPRGELWLDLGVLRHHLAG